MATFSFFTVLTGIYIVSWNRVAVRASGQIQPESMAAVIGSHGDQENIQINNIPSVLTSTHVTVEYRCSGDRYIGVEVTADIGRPTPVTVFQKVWKCHATIFKMVKVRIKLPAYLKYNLNALNPVAKATSGAIIRAWVLDPALWPECKQQGTCYARAVARVTYDVDTVPPFSRPFFRPDCLPWSSEILVLLSSVTIPTCPAELETVDMVRYPAALTGLTYGIYRQLVPYRDPDLEATRQQELDNPRFTVSIWLYLLEYCDPTRASLCSIFQHFNRQGEYLTPLIFINKDGQLHIQANMEGGYSSAAIAAFVLPRHQWCRLVLSFDKTSWNLKITYGQSLNQTWTSNFIFSHPIWIDDTEGLFSIGGTERTPSFRGYVGQVTFYRRLYKNPDEIPYPRASHPMFELGLSKREERCESYLSWIRQQVSLYRARRETLKADDRCSNFFYDVVHVTEATPLPTCPVSVRTRHKPWRLAARLVKRSVLSGRQVKWTDIAEKIYDNATALLGGGLENMPAAVPLFKQAACLGSEDAMYRLAVILNNGVHVKTDEIQTHAYLMLAALGKHRLSALALGHRHRYGLDGVPEDWEQSYMYYKYVADTTREDKEKHKDTDVLTESVLLTDEFALREQIDEGGDIYTWLTHQAKQGVLSAQVRIGRALFWGSEGLKRNLEAAREYFRMSAESEDPQSMYDYGIILLRGQGTEKDVEEGLKHIQKAAETQNPSALNALGWYAMVYNVDYRSAAGYFEEAHKHGHPDAAYNLGILHLHGNYPDMAADSEVALQYFTVAAQRHQVDAGVMVAGLNMVGTSQRPRDLWLAIEWARFIAEKNPALGMLLRQALQAYRRGQHDVALFYYMLAADAGVSPGSFNLAWLCDENKDGVTAYLGKECQWRHFNLTTQREIQFVNSYALLKMGDYYWYGCGGTRDVRRAANLYAEAANKQDAQALFNLAFMVDEGETVSTSVLDYVRVPRDIQRSKSALLDHLYSRCMDSSDSEAFIPCRIASFRVQLRTVWEKYQLWIEVSGFAGALSISVISLYRLYNHIRYHGNGQTDYV